MGEELKRLRLARGYGLRELAKRAGVTPAMLSEIENDKRDPQVSTVKKIADALGARVTLAAKND